MMKYWDHSSEPVWVQPGPSFHMAASQAAPSEKLLAKMSFCRGEKKVKGFQQWLWHWGGICRVQARLLRTRCWIWQNQPLIPRRGVWGRGGSHILDEKRQGWGMKCDKTIMFFYLGAVRLQETLSALHEESTWGCNTDGIESAPRFQVWKGLKLAVLRFNTVITARRHWFRVTQPSRDP